MQADYLNLSRAQDLKNPKEKFLYRFFEIFPGFLSWGTLGGAFILSWLAPVVVAIFIIAFDLYWLLRISYLSFHQLASYKQMKKNLKIDWMEKLKSLNPPAGGKRWPEIYHLIILPMYKEGIDIVKPTLQALENSNYPQDKMIVVLATEERAGAFSQKLAKEIKGEFGKIFFRFLITVHPKDIPGEVAGKGSNQAWAAKIAKEKIIDPLKILYQNIIVSGFDIDTRVYPQYFACLTWHYLTAKSPLRSSYQPIPVYNNNIWRAPAFSRVISTSGTFWQMMQQERPEQLVSYSSHSLPFKIFEDIGFPSDIVSDDSRIFWKSYLAYDGDYKVVPLYYPVSMDAVMAKNLLGTALNQYKQQRRWAWGCENIPYVLYGFLKNKKIPLGEKFRHCLNLLDGFWSWATCALLIFFLGWLPLILGGEGFNISLLSYNLPRLTGQIMTVAMIGMVTAAIISMLLLPPRPVGSSPWKNLSMIFQWLLLPLTLIGFGTFPALDAQTRLMLGKPLGFWVTEKISPPPLGSNQKPNNQ
ncbi:MAG: hypothetical protein COX44_00325 [Candidatus Portnoybacteria bacterium CG23_combo_of_CG06-09_8_20_14_all_37_13]|uniref:Glycosyltransferase 2-like domain-containing protein n=1 Tax=Candidatus Portnoybacteria bacterium CG23_combo_of_CG06-09_8_20_14_all_37_13 TaxID=1974819 RepID=A0A2G9YDQ2_9BACT|nr:MAG: hypothetical protein COX44_00325 [Candidatus Portnoybacteria bacterium CG23_combo_of_CG06-09_8_20_14_all_37_13]